MVAVIARTIAASASRTARVQPAQVGLARGSRISARTYTEGPSKVESQPQGSDQRGKATTYILPFVAVTLAVGAFGWRFSSGDKASTVGVGVRGDGPDKLQSGAARRVNEGK